jgi:hypothetical protein
LLNERVTIAQQADGVRVSVQALLAYYESYNPNSLEERESVDAAAVQLRGSLVGIDEFLVALQKIETDVEAEEAGRIIGERFLQMLQAWSDLPAGAMVVKSALGTVLLGFAALFSPWVTAELSLAIMATGVYGRDAVAGVIRAVRGSLEDKSDDDDPPENDRPDS